MLQKKTNSPLEHVLAKIDQHSRLMVKILLPLTTINLLLLVMLLALIITGLMGSSEISAPQLLAILTYFGDYDQQ
ncbi:MAG: hypothetical protein ACJARX_000357 [Psychroserpens sp.]|uniref:hypothetical protein n=1 Tax=Psychroserpens sp. TaxID=2020870 RepID=UPI0039E576E4